MTLDRREVLLSTGEKARIGVYIEGLSVCSEWIAFPSKM